MISSHIFIYGYQIVERIGSYPVSFYCLGKSLSLSLSLSVCDDILVIQRNQTFFLNTYFLCPLKNNFVS